MHVLMRDERRKKEASKVKQTTRQSKAVTFPKKNELLRVGIEPTTLYTLDRALYLTSTYKQHIDRAIIPSISLIPPSLSLSLSPSEKMHWCEQKPSGSAPPPLAAHGCAIIGTRLYIFGGLTTSCACDTLHCLDTGAALLPSLTQSLVVSQ